MKKIFPLFFLLVSLSTSAQILHDNTCSGLGVDYVLDWDSSPSSTQFDWTPQGGTSFLASNIEGEGGTVKFTISGATGSLTTENSISTPGVTNSLSGGEDALHISTDGLTSTEEIVVKMEFLPAISGNISFDLYNIIELAGGGAGGQQIEVYALSSDGFALVPELTDNGSPSWEVDGPGVIQGNATSTVGTNDQVGVNFKSIGDVTEVYIILRRCSDCANAVNTEFAISDISFCLSPDTDLDGIVDYFDQDDDNDGISDILEKCQQSAPVLVDWDNYPYNNGDPSNTYGLPDGTNMTVGISSNGASIAAAETNSDLSGGEGGGTVGLFLNGNQNLQVNSIDVNFNWDRPIDNLSYTIFDVDQLGGQYIDSITIIGYYNGFVVFPSITGSADNTVSQNRVVGDVSTDDALATANIDVSFPEPIDSMTIYYGNGSNSPPAPGNQWITIWDLTYVGDCGEVDTDNDGVPDYLDIDADNDGIVDYIEWQASSASPIAPSGTDIDGNGIDDNFEGLANSFPLDTDGDGVPDFKDTDSDNDGDLDILEAWDTNNNGTANTLPSGTDSDGDGLDDNFDDQNGFNSTTNVTNLGQTSEGFPNLDEVGTSQRDWRESNAIDDNDGDGIADEDDIDDDNDGVLDVDEGCAAADVPSTFGSSSGGVTDDTEAAGSPDGQFAQIYTNGQFVILNFGQVFPAGTQYRITWRLRNTVVGTAEMDLYESTGAAGPWTEHPTALPTNSDPVNFTAEIVTSDIDFQYLRFGKGNYSTTDYEIDAVEVIAASVPADVTPSIVGNVGLYTVSSDGQLTVLMTGGEGGGGSNTAGGSGASIEAVFDVLSGDVVRFVVGDGSDAGSTSAGGGGSTGLFINNTLMMVAGGGGGGDNSGGAIGLGANTGTAGDNGTGNAGTFGTGGAGGAGGTSGTSDGAGGGGINSAGANGVEGGGGSAADLVPSDGVTFQTGGTALNGNASAGGGGFTSGGGGGNNWSGGAGGYSGGGAAGSGGSAGGGGSYLNTGDPSYVSGSITAGTNGGGGASGVNGADGAVTLSLVSTSGGDCSLDTDNDGIIDSFDLDSDGDGIADIIEAGGVDINGDGKVDGVFRDTDGDGWSNTFDSDDGGTALTDSDTDGDGFEDRIDIDSDDDGIVDIIESQPSGSLTSPSGSDDNGNGIDDNFDVSSGNSLTVPINTDGLDNPDYTDTDSDNDGDLDELEGWDTDNDGTADTSPAGTDSDNDGLDDNYDNIIGPNSTTNITNSGQTSANFPNLDITYTETEDWREDEDYDGDGISNEDDIDDDNDGILDVNECDASVIFEGGFDGISGLNVGVNNLGVSILPWILTSGGTNVIRVDGAGGTTYGIGGPEFDARGSAGNYFDINGSGQIYQTFTLTSTQNLFYEGYFSARDGGTGTGDISIRTGTGVGGTVVSTTSTITTSDNVNWTYVSNTAELTAGTYSFVVNMSNPINFDEGAIIVICDNDNDGIPNQFDLDSDNDGIADIVEAGGFDNNGDGVVDGTFTDTDNDGWSDTFDPNNSGTPLSDPDTDGDGLENRIDIDADDDGIIDIIEGQVSGTLISLSGTDSDNDGIDDNFDPDNGNALISPVNTDGTDNPDYTDTDADNDGDLDELEGWDTDNDGIANTLPSGSDLDSDGLDDNYDDIVGANNTTNPTNNFQNSSSFPDLDNTSSLERDWREASDSDEDGIADIDDIDDDNDGILDVDEGEGSNNPAGDEDGDGILNYLDVSDGGNGGDGSTTNYTDTDGNGIPDVFDTDEDGIPNHLDLDADDDGIADIIEAGGVDSDGDGRGDASADFDNDGFLAVFDTDDGGTALANPETDGDGINNFLDLDSDSDGITDNVEGRLTSNTTLPLGNDIDDDGWDDAYDGDVTGGANGVPIQLSNNDGTGEPDYLDLDSDDDGLPDYTEGFDDDLDGDALNDLIGRANIFEALLGGIGKYLNILDFDFDGIPNWAEDSDLDGTPNYLDPDNGFYSDDDNDGLVDLFDSDDGGEPSNVPDQDADGEYDFRDIDNSGGGLPVELLEFKAKKAGELIQLDWVTVTEINNDYFKVQKLNEDGDFETIGKVDGAGNSNEQLVYRSYDLEPINGENYYRLQQVDFDGTESYSETRVVNFSELNFELKIYPNPSNGRFIFAELSGEITENIVWKIFDDKGREILSSLRTETTKDKTQKIDLLKGKVLIPGMYFVQIINGENAIIEKVVIQ